MTDFTKAPLADVMRLIDQMRIEKNMSYQALGDACNISKSTTIRYLRLEIEPPYSFVQNASAAVGLVPEEQFVFPEDHTIEGYNNYLKSLITKLNDEMTRLKMQHQAEINRLRAHYIRMIAIVAGALGGLLAVFFVTFIAFRAIDMHLTNDNATPVDVCESCDSEIEEHSQFCAWCGHEQVSHLT